MILIYHLIHLPQTDINVSSTKLEGVDDSFFQMCKLHRI